MPSLSIGGDTRERASYQPRIGSQDPVFEDSTLTPKDPPDTVNTVFYFVVLADKQNRTLCPDATEMLPETSLE